MENFGTNYRQTNDPHRVEFEREANRTRLGEKN